MTVRRYLIEGDSAQTAEHPPDLAQDLAGPLEAERRLAELSARLEQSPHLDRRPWGSEFDASPWPASLPAELPAAVEQALRDRFMAQRQGRVPRLTWRLHGPPAGLLTLTLELHDELAVLELRGTDSLGPDAFLTAGQRVRTEHELLAELEPVRGGKEAAEDALLRAREAIVAVGALWHSDLRLLALLRELAGHPRRELRSAVIAAASRLGFRLFLLELLAVESDRMLQRVLEPVTAFAEQA